MAKATITIRQRLKYQPQQAAWFAATQALFNRVAAFYFEVIQAHRGVLDLSTKEALTACPTCGMQGHADRNASLVIGQRLITRYQPSSQEKPPTPLATERESKDSGVVLSQDAERKQEPSIALARHGEDNEQGTAQEKGDTDGCALSDMPPPLRSQPCYS